VFHSGRPGTNTLAYYKKSVNYGQISFITLAPSVKVIDLFFFVVGQEAK
jgi:hypothetical protein